MKRACVMGFPVSHSLSPKLHGFWLKKYNIDGEYTLQEVKPENLKIALDRLQDDGFAGCNLTLPLKEHALNLLDELDSSCTQAGAVNTVIIRNGIKIGFNSDGFGFVESMKAQCPTWNRKNIVIIGTGGAARGIIPALQKTGAQHFQLINRTPEKAEKLICDQSLQNATVVQWENRHKALEDATLLINCTSLGMTGQPPLELNLSMLPISAAVCDIVYRPLITPLLSQAKQRGHAVIEGLPMLLHQGRLGFQHWFGFDPEVTAELYNEITKSIT